MALAYYPDIGLNVSIELTFGAVLVGYWDGAIWWVGVNDMPEDVPLNGEYVAGWTALG